MKRIFMLGLMIAAMAAFAASSSAAVRDFRNRDATVSVSTSAATMVGGYLPGRIYYLVINESTSYEVRLATWAINQAGAQSASSGIPLAANKGNWEDKYNIYQSSWYVIISSNAAPADAAALSAVITYRQRD